MKCSRAARCSGSAFRPLCVKLPGEDPTLLLSRCKCPGCEPVSSNTAIQQVPLSNRQVLRQTQPPLP
jgi:hypothetical protein